MRFEFVISKLAKFDTIRANLFRLLIFSQSPSMLVVVISAAILLALTTLIHYEVLRFLNVALPSVGIPSRSKLLVVIFATFFAHVLEMATYGIAIYWLVLYASVGSLAGSSEFSLSNCLYFSAETYTSLGFGDLTPRGPIRLLVGVEALNGLLLIGWSASYAYLAMERFWQSDGEKRKEGDI